MNDIPEKNQANLGCASTEELFRELISRFRPNSTLSTGNVDRALILAEMLGGLDEADKEYKTVYYG